MTPEEYRIYREQCLTYERAKSEILSQVSDPERYDKIDLLDNPDYKIWFEDVLQFQDRPQGHLSQGKTAVTKEELHREIQEALDDKCYYDVQVLAYLANQMDDDHICIYRYD